MSNLNSRGVLIALAMHALACQAHDEKLHREITKKALIASTGSQSFINATLGIGGTKLKAGPPPLQSDPTATSVGFSAEEWIVEGSYYEDATEYGSSKIREQYRCLNHFYTTLPFPTPLSDWSEAPFGYIPKGNVDSFTWATTKGQSGPNNLPSVDFQNDETWANAREHQFDALTQGGKSARDLKLAYMFYSIGHVLHLNQDLSSPDHVRNDSHRPTKGRAFFEDYGRANYRKHLSDDTWFKLPPVQRRGFTYWNGRGFRKLEAFWNRYIYNGDRNQLIADALNLGDPYLGLAEFSNGNFLGEDALYRESLDPNDKTDRLHVFPFPSLRSGTTFPFVERSLPLNVVISHRKDGITKNFVDLQKLSDGIKVESHSRLLLLGTRAKGQAGAVMEVASTIEADDVLESYHRILLPKAIEYSAGILDYFFRGKLEITLVPNTSSGYDLTIKNVSGQDFHGGEFRLYWDDASGNRTQLENPGNSTVGNFIPDWSGSSEVANNGTVSATFKPPTAAVKSYTLVYKGTIGAASSSDPHYDAVDNGIAIAAKTFPPFVWWKMEEPSGDFVDAGHGIHLIGDESSGGTISTVQGKIGNAVQLSANPDQECWLDVATSPLMNSGLGITRTGWLKHSGLHEDNFMFLQMSVDRDEWMLQSAWDGTGFELDTGVDFLSAGNLSANVWHFFIMEYDPTAETVTVEFNRSGTVYSASALGPAAAGPRINIFDYCGAFGVQSMTWALDETGVFPMLLTTAQKNFLWNGGNGRTYPFVLP